MCAPEQAIQRPISCSKQLKIQETKSNKENRAKSYYLYYSAALWHAVSKHSEQGTGLISYQQLQLLQEGTVILQAGCNPTVSNLGSSGGSLSLLLLSQEPQAFAATFAFQSELQQVSIPVLSNVTGNGLSSFDWHLPESRMLSLS